MNDEERKQIEEEIWNNYNADVQSELMRYGKRFVIAAVIICLVLCGIVHHNTKAGIEKKYNKQLKAKNKQIKVLKEYKRSAQESATANYYQCTKKVSGIIIGKGYGSSVKFEKGDIVREVSSDEDREIVMYTQAGYGNIKVQVDADKFDDDFVDVDVPIGN
jgi:hypothetical protein